MPMKSGTGEDPFADDPEPPDQDEETVSESQATEDVPDTASNETSIADESGDTGEPAKKEAPDEREETEPRDGLDRDDIPWVLRRSRVKDDRPEMIPMYVREETANREPEFVRTVEEAVGKDVYKFDVREAALLVAMNHPEEVAEQLNRWGYEFLD